MFDASSLIGFYDKLSPGAIFFTAEFIVFIVLLPLAASFAKRRRK